MLFLVYYIVSSISQGSVNALLLIIIIVISVYYVFKVNHFKNLPVYFKGLNVFLLLLSIYGFYLAFTHGNILIRETGNFVKSNTNLRFLYGSMLPIYPCYYFARKGMLTEKALRYWTFIFFIVAYISYYFAMIHHVQRALELGLNAEDTNFTNNVAYTFLMVMPCLSLFIKRKYIFFSGLTICLFLILAASKRGAILISILIAIILLRKYFQSLKLSLNKKVVSYIILFVFLYIAAIFVINYINSNEYLYAKLLSIQDGNSSGRDYITDYFLNMYINIYSFPEMIFGGGADYTIISGPNYAHNDWIEVLINEGLVGLVCYLFYWFCFYKTYMTYRNCRFGFIIGIIAVILILKSIFSMSYTAMNLYVCSILGFCLYQCEYELLKK